ncbi:MAG: phage holin family protein [Planctomycetales bacterium]|nr:phage holin family protein [Planctomycetales bacterium]
MSLPGDDTTAPEHDAGRQSSATVRLRRDLGEWAAAHVELAQLEAAEAGRALGGLGLRWALAYTAVVVGLSLAAVGAVAWAAERFETSPHLMAILVGLALVVVAVGLGGWTYRRFRNQFTAFEQTIEELREDVVWFREHVARDGRDT